MTGVGRWLYSCQEVFPISRSASLGKAFRLEPGKCLCTCLALHTNSNPAAREDCQEDPSQLLNPGKAD